MRKYLSVVLAVAAVVPLFSQENISSDSLYSSVVRMEGDGYTLGLKELGAFERFPSSAEGYALDADPYGHEDYTPPSRPVGVRATALDASTVRVSYLAATDDIRVIGYRIYRDGGYVGFTPDERYTDTGLSESTSYRYAVQAVDKEWNLSELSDGVYVTTLDATTASSAPHFVTGPSVLYVTDRVAVIGVRADKAVTARVEYGTSTAYGSVVETGEYLTEQIVTISALEASKGYHYRVTIDDYGLHGPEVSGDDSFHTLAGADLRAPEFVEGPDALYVSDRIATISFETDEETQGFLLYGESSVHEERVDEPYYDTEHYVTLYALEPSTSYRYEVSVTDRSSNGPVSSATRRFVTSAVADTTPPVIHKKPKAEYLTDRMAIIGWETDEPSTSVVRFGTVAGIFDRQVVSQLMTRRHQLVLLNLQPHTKYYFAASSTDPSGNTSEESKEKHFTTFMHPDDTAPKVKRIEVEAGVQTATIRWETDELAESKLVYGSSSGAYTGQVYGTKLRTEHELRLQGLQGGTRYYFQVLAKDPSGNEVQMPEYSFRTTDEDRRARDRGRGHDDDDHRDRDERDRGDDGRGNGGGFGGRGNGKE